MAYTAAQINTIWQAVLQRPADSSAIMQFANSTQSDASVRTQIETSYEANVNVNPIIRLYEGAFGRTPDTAGLQANYNTFINGYNVTSLAQSFLNGPEGVAKFGANATVTAGFVSTIYTQALNRTAGASEISYWQGTGKSAAQVLAEISNSSEAVNKEAAPIVTYLDSAAVAALNGGTPNSGSLYNQTPGTGAGGTSGSTITFTATNGDNLQGTSGNDTFTGVSTGANVAGDTIQTGDLVVGGAGTDTVVYTASSGAISLPTLSSVEVVNLSARTAAVTADFSNSGVSLVTLQNTTTGAADAITLKAGQVAGLDNVKFATATTETFDFGTASTSASLAVANGTAITGSGAVDIKGAAIATLNVLSTGSAANTIASLTDSTNTTALKTLNISGDKGLTLTTGITSLTTVDATADNAGVKFSGTETGLTSAKFGGGNDSFLTGDSFASGAAANTATIDGGTGLNYLGANQASLASLLATGNKVTNFQVLEVQNTVTAAGTGGQTYDLSKIAGLSSIQFDGSITETTAGGAATFSNLVSGGSIYFGGDVTTTAAAAGTAASLVFTVAGAATNANDVETLFLAKNIDSTAAGTTHAVQAFTLANVENLVLNVRDVAGTDSAGTATFAGVADASLKSIVLQATAADLTGAQVKAAALTVGGGFDTTALTTFDASGYAQNVDASGLATNYTSAGATIRGGAGDLYAVGGAGTDAIISGTGGGIFNGGAGTDAITLSATTTNSITLTQASLTTGSGTLKVLDVVQVSTGGSLTATTADSVTGFHLGAAGTASDVLAFAGTATGGVAPAFAAATGLNVTTVAGAVNASSAGQTSGVQVTINNSGFATVTGATGTDSVTAVQKYLNTAGNFATAAIVVGSDTYVVHNGGATTTTDDAIVKLVGVSSAVNLSTTDFGASTIHIA